MRSNSKPARFLFSRRKMYGAVSIDLTRTSNTTSTYNANPYNSYSLIVEQLSACMDQTADWGGPQIQMAIQLRAATAVGEGISLVALDDDSADEVSFLKKFVHKNGLDSDVPYDAAVDAEIEGRALFHLVQDTDGIPIVRPIQYLNTPYKVNVAANDYRNILSVVVRNQGQEYTWTKPSIVYRTFCARSNRVNDPVPVIGGAIVYAENIDKGIRDWREMNRKVAIPTPVFEVEDGAEADEVRAGISATNWKIGDAIVTTASFKMVGVDASRIETFDKEQINNIHRFSGKTGIPPHFLGHPEMMSNRATASELVGLLSVTVSKPRKTWKSFYTELFDKALLMANKRPGRVVAEIASTTAEQISSLTGILFPAYDKGVVSKKTVQDALPGVDTELETERLETEAKEQQAKAQANEAQSQTSNNTVQ